MSDLDEFLAVSVMGWHKQDLPTPYWWLNEKNEGAYKIKDFRPTTNIEQAMMVVERFRGFSLHKNTAERRNEGYELFLNGASSKPSPRYSNMRYSVMILEDWMTWEHANTLPLAISLACARARGYEDE